MWDIKYVKHEARINLKRNYWAMIAVCFLMAFLMSEYSIAGELFTAFGESDATVATNGHILGQAVSPSNIINYYVSDLMNFSTIENHSVSGTQGIFAALLNGSARGINILKYAVYAGMNFMAGHKILQGMTAILLVAMNLAFFIFVKNMFIVGERRFFLENKQYHDTQIRRLLFPYHKGYTWNVAKIMFLREIFNLLWAFTIIGGVYKYYEYKMIRFILAENPEIDRKTCFALSKEMMRGNKWRLFLQDLSFVPWYIASIITMGVLAWFFVNPYYTASETEVYFVLRDRAYTEGLKGYELLNDDYLVNEPEVREKDIYPTLVIHERESHLHNWKKYYSPVNLSLFFFTFMVIGWVWEVIYTFMLHGELVNRGSLHGPWLPIYGIGGTMIIILFRKLGDKPHLMFVLAFVCCGIMEYSTGWYFDNVKGIKYWDYSNYFLNLNGYICLEGLLMFAILACFGFYIIAPWLDDQYNKIPMSIRCTILVAVIPLFGLDVIYSHFIPNEGEGIGGADYKQ